MKRIIIITIVNLMLVLVQDSFLANLFGTFTPNLVLALAFSFIILGFSEVGFISAFIGGLFLDLFGFETVGLSSLVFVGSIMLFKFVRKYLFRGWLFSYLSSFVINILYIFIISGFSTSSKLMVNGSVSTSIVVLIFYLSIRNFSQYFEKSEYSFRG